MHSVAQEDHKGVLELLLARGACLRNQDREARSGRAEVIERNEE